MAFKHVIKCAKVPLTVTYWCEDSPAFKFTSSPVAYVTIEKRKKFKFVSKCKDFFYLILCENEPWLTEHSVIRCYKLSQTSFKVVNYDFESLEQKSTMIISLAEYKKIRETYYTMLTIIEIAQNTLKLFNVFPPRMQPSILDVLVFTRDLYICLLSFYYKNASNNNNNRSLPYAYQRAYRKKQEQNNTMSSEKLKVWKADVQMQRDAVMQEILTVCDVLSSCSPVTLCFEHYMSYAIERVLFNRTSTYLKHFLNAHASVLQSCREKVCSDTTTWREKLNKTLLLKKMMF